MPRWLKRYNLNLKNKIKCLFGVHHIVRSHDISYNPDWKYELDVAAVWTHQKCSRCQKMKSNYDVVEAAFHFMDSFTQDDMVEFVEKVKSDIQSYTQKRYPDGEGRFH